MKRSRELNKQDSDNSTFVKNHHVEPAPNHNSCGGCNSCHQMTGIHSMAGGPVWGESGDEEQGSNIQKSCATNFLQRNLGNSYMQNIAGDRQTSGSSSSWSSTPMIQKKCSCGGSCSGCSGEEELQRIQAKFSIGPTDDVYEKEADHVADKVLQKNIREQDIKNPVTIKPIPIQRRSNHSGLQVADLDLNKSNGRPMNQQLQGDMESRFGYSFKNVRIHNDAGADHLARSINSHAFTLGRDIYFGGGNYNPTSRDGKHLLAHELTHVVQQGYGNATQPKKINNNLQRAEDEEEEGAVANDKLQAFERRKEADRREFEGISGGSVGAEHTGMGESEATVSPEAFGIQRSWIQRNNDCGDPSMTRRGSAQMDLDSDSWRAYVYAFSSVTATHDTLSVRLWARGSAYFLIWVTSGSLDFTATVDISCRRVGRKCEIFPNERAGSTTKASDSPISGAIAINTQRRASDTELVMTPHTGAGVEAGGGVGAGVGPASIGVSFPGGGMSRTRSHGTHRWSCEDSVS